MNIRKYFWNLNEEAIRETKEILKKSDHPRFTPRMHTLLSRCNDPKELFSLINKERFIEMWPRIRQYWKKTSQAPDFRAWWETIYEKLLEKQKDIAKIRKLKGEPLNEFKNIGRIIRNSRISKGWSQSDFARKAGMKQPDISAIESGKKNITIGTLIRLCRILDITEMKLNLSSHLKK